MEKLLLSLKGQSVDVSCGTSAVFRGQIEDVADGVLHLTDEEKKVTFIQIEKISSVCERSDSHSRPGFIA